MYVVSPVSLPLFLLAILLPMTMVDCRSVRRTSSGRRHASSHINHDRLAAIQRDLLNRMELKTPPNIEEPKNASESVSEQRRMLQLYRRTQQELSGQHHDIIDKDDHLAKEFLSFTQQETYPDGVRSDHWYSSTPSTLRLHFDVSIPQPSHPNREKLIHSASLKLLKAAVRPEKLPMSPTIDLVYRINIYQLLEPVLHARHRPLRRLLDSKLVSLEKRDWETFDIRSAVQHWADDPSSNFGIEVEGENDLMPEVLDLVTVQPGRISSEEVLPRLDIFTQMRTIITNRQRRSDPTMDCMQGDGSTKCCRYPVWIDFSDFGWDKWILEPKGFQAYFCDGACPHRYKSANLFTDIKSFMNMHNPRAMPAPVCTATKFSPLTIGHYNEEGNLVVSSLDDMIVEECMCV